MLGAPVFLGVCTEPITCASRRPITALQVIHVDRGEKPAPGFTPIANTVGGLEANLNYGGGGRDIQLCAARALDKLPLCRLEVLVRSKGGLRVPHGCLLVRGDDGKPSNLNAGALGSTVHLAFERARPTALLQTPLKPAILDGLAASDRPQPQTPGATAPPPDARSAASDEGRDVGGPTTPRTGGVPPLTGAAAATAALPHAIAHFCFPQGALLRDECRWPTTHQFALTDTQGQTLHGCCLTVWEPLASQLVMTAPTRGQAEAEAEAERRRFRVRAAISTEAGRRRRGGVDAAAAVAEGRAETLGEALATFAAGSLAAAAAAAAATAAAAAAAAAAATAAAAAAAAKSLQELGHLPSRHPRILTPT